MKRHITFALTISWIFAMSLSAQPRLTSSKETHNFGQVEWKKPVTVDYSITNTGNQPLVLTNVTTSCACAVLDWTKTPIQPGERGAVKATFDAKMLGHFHKSVGIYSNATSNLVYLYFTGEVVRKVTDFSNFQGYSIGNILVDTTEITFPDVHRGERPELTINVVNLSDRPYEPVLMHLPPYLLMEANPGTLQKGERGIIRLTLDTDRLPDLGLTQAPVYLSRFAGDKVNEENEIPFSVVLLPDFSQLNRVDKQNVPHIQLSQTEIDLSAKLDKRDKASHDIVITNAGKSVLEINKLQVFNPAVSVDLKKASIQPGEKTKLKITLNKKGLSKKKHLRVLMITNDPDQPKVTINLKL